MTGRFLERLGGQEILEFIGSKRFIPGVFIFGQFAQLQGALLFFGLNCMLAWLAVLVMNRMSIEDRKNEETLFLVPQLDLLA